MSESSHSTTAPHATQSLILSAPPSQSGVGNQALPSKPDSKQQDVASTPIIQTSSNQNIIPNSKGNGSLGGQNTNQDTDIVQKPTSGINSNTNTGDTNSDGSNKHGESVPNTGQFQPGQDTSNDQTSPGSNKNPSSTNPDNSSNSQHGSDVEPHLNPENPGHNTANSGNDSNDSSGNNFDSSGHESGANNGQISQGNPLENSNDHPPIDQANEGTTLSSHTMIGFIIAFAIVYLS